MVLAFFALPVFAQVEFEHDSTDLIYVDMTNFQYSAVTSITNNSADPTDTVFIWERISNDLPTEWSSAICDKDLCYPEDVHTAEYIIPIGATVTFKINFYTNNTKGCGDVTVVLTSKKDDFNNDTLYAPVCSFDPLSVNEVAYDVNIYPNPTTSEVTLKTNMPGNSIVSVYDILGNKVLEKSVFSGEKLNVSELPEGVYILRMEGDKIVTKTFQKI